MIIGAPVMVREADIVLICPCVSLCAYVCVSVWAEKNYKNTDKILVQIGKNVCYD